jgi:hypothetical protein
MRIQLELSQNRVDELKGLMQEADIETYKELFNNALTLLQWSVQQVKAGRAIASVDEDNTIYNVMVMPILEQVATKSRRGAAPQLSGVR